MSTTVRLWRKPNGDPIMHSDNDEGARAGAVVLLIFGLFFVEANVTGLDGGLRTAARIAAVIVALVLFAAIRRAGSASNGERPRLGRWFWVVVAAEVVALVAGIVVINTVIGAHDLTAPWIAVVVGVHFFAFVPLWRARFYLVLGVVVTLLGVAGFVVYGLGGSAQAIRVVSGLGPGVVLYLAAASSLVRGR